jgi:Beta-carotene isomerase D27-like, C-terminal
MAAPPSFVPVAGLLPVRFSLVPLRPQRLCRRRRTSPLARASSAPPSSPPPSPPPSPLRGPSTPPPDYSRIDSNPLNKYLTALFAARLADELGVPPPPASDGYAAVVRLVAGLSERANGDGGQLTEAAVRVLDSLLPRWLPPAFAAVISRPMPRFAAWINAVVTLAVTQWLMGPSHFADDGSMTVEIERCRYLEENGCVGTCISSCKSATEAFFARSMGHPLYIEPDFEDYSCKFRFGVEPPPASEQKCLSEPCFRSCPITAAAGALTTPKVCSSLQK